MNLKNKTIIVTGASKGVGREICALLAKEEANVVAVSRSPAEVVEEIKEYGGEALWIKADVSNEKQMKNVFEKTKKKFGEIYGLVNNAGILLSKPINKTSYEEFDKVMKVNVRGEFIGCKLAREYIKKGVIVNAASDVGVCGNGKPNLSIYTMSKFAIAGMTESLAKEFYPRIRVYAVAPRSIATDMSKGRGNSPVLVAKLYVKLLKQETNHKPGSVILVGKESDANKFWKNGVPSVSLR